MSASAATAGAFSHTVTWDPPPERAAYAGLTPLEAMRKSIAEGRRRSPISALMDIDLVSADPGRVVMRGRPGLQHYNPIGIVHGGFAATLLDASLWSAVQTTLEPGYGNTTIDLKVNYFRPLKAETGEVTCEATIINRGRKIALAEARITDADGRLYAHGVSTLMILEP